MDGNSAMAEPVRTDNATPEGTIAEPQGQDGVEGLKAEIAKLKEQYSNSSREAHKLVDQLREERDARLRLEGSLKYKEQHNTQGFPDEEPYVKYWTEIGLDEKIARAEYRDKKINYENQRVLHNQLLAMQNMVRFQREENEKAWQETNPDAQRAIEFAKGIPELEALPVGEKIQRMKELQTRFGVKVEGRDTTAIKMAASGAGGSSSRAVDAQVSSEMDDAAKAMGLPNGKCMEELGKCKTQQDHAAWKQRWKQ